MREYHSNVDETVEKIQKGELKLDQINDYDIYQMYGKGYEKKITEGLEVLDKHNIRLRKSNCATAHWKGVAGCKTFQRDIMISLGGGGPIQYTDGANKIVAQSGIMDIVDVFLTQEQAENMHQQLGECLQRNKDKS